MNDFDYMLKDAIYWEKFFRSKYVPSLKHIARNYSYDYVDDNGFTFDLKTRGFFQYRDDVLLEDKSNVEGGTIGWVYKQELDYVFYGWKNQGRTDYIEMYLVNRKCAENEIRFFDGYYNMRCRWCGRLFSVRKSKFRYVLSSSDGCKYHTLNIAVGKKYFDGAWIFKLDLSKGALDVDGLVRDGFRVDVR